MIDYHLDQEIHELFDGEVELDESQLISLWGGLRKGKRGRGAAGKTAVFGVLKRNDKVYTVAVKNTKKDTLMPIITSKIKPDSIVYTDSYKSYNALDVNNFIHFRINHSKEFAKERNHINGTLNFWSQAKRHLRKFNGIPKEHFYLFLKECEWRFNNSNPKSQLTQWIRGDLG